LSTQASAEFQELRELGQSQSQLSPQKIPSVLAVMPPIAQATLVQQPVMELESQQSQEWPA
jgi:hypothetical protein